MHLFGITQDAPRLGDLTPFVFTYKFLAVATLHARFPFNLLNSVLHTRWMGKMHSDGSLNKIKTEKSVFGFLRRKRRCKVHISPEITEIEKLSSLFSPHTSPVPIYWNTPVKIRNYYLSESTAQLLPPPLPVKIMSKIQARTPDLTVNTGTANDTKAPSKQVADTVFSAIIDPSPRSFEHQKAEPFRRVVSLNKSQSMGVIEDKARSLELSPTRNEPVKPEESPTEVNKSADSSSEPSSDDRLDREDLLQAEYNKLFQIGRESGYDDDDVRQWVDYVLEHGLPDFQTGPEMDAESIDTEVDWNKARVPEFTQRDPAVKEIERHYLQDIFGKDIISTHQLLVDNQYTSDAFAASSGQNAIYLHGNSDIASHTTLKAYCHDSTSPSSSSAASHSFHLAAPKIEHSTDIDCRGSDDRSATPTAGREWFRADMNDDEFRESPDIGFKSKDTATQKRELKVTGTSVLKDTQHQGAFLPSGLTDNSLYLDKHGSLNTNTIDSNGLIPLLLPLRYNKASPAAHRRTFNASTAARVTDPLSEAADLSGIASEISTSYPDSPTLGYAHLSTPSTISQSIDTLTSSQPLPRSLPSCSPSANDKMKVSQKNVGSGKFKASPRDVGLPSPCDTFSESSFDSRRRESTLSTKWDEEMQYTIEKVGSRGHITPLPGSY